MPSMGQRGSWEEHQGVVKLENKKPVILRLSNSIPRESFRLLLDKSYAQKREGNAGRRRIDPLIHL
jgi:hypothetical protein